MQASAADTEGRIGGCCLCNCAGGGGLLLPHGYVQSVLGAGIQCQRCAAGMNNKAAADDWRIKLAMPLLVLFDWLMAQQRIARYL